jgi:hypothetical protein
MAAAPNATNPMINPVLLDFGAGFALVVAPVVFIRDTAGAGMEARIAASTGSAASAAAEGRNDGIAAGEAATVRTATGADACAIAPEGITGPTLEEAGVFDEAGVNDAGGSESRAAALRSPGGTQTVDGRSSQWSSVGSTLDPVASIGGGRFVGIAPSSTAGVGAAGPGAMAASRMASMSSPIWRIPAVGGEGSCCGAVLILGMRTTPKPAGFCESGGIWLGDF